MGITNTLATIPGMITPVLVTSITGGKVRDTNFSQILFISVLQFLIKNVHKMSNLENHSFFF